MLFFLIIGTLTGLSWAVVHSLKDTSVSSSSGALTATSTGDPASTSSSDYVTINGRMVPRSYVERLVNNSTSASTATKSRRLHAVQARRLMQTATATPATGSDFSSQQPPTETGTYQQNTDPSQYNATPTVGQGDLTPAMIDTMAMHGPAMPCATSERRFGPLDSMMNPDALAEMRRVTIYQARTSLAPRLERPRACWTWPTVIRCLSFRCEQGPTHFTFKVSAGGSMPRCALQPSPNPDTHPCDGLQPQPWDVVVVVYLDSIGPILLDRNAVRHCCGLTQLRQRVGLLGGSILL